jgi:uncharacterized protein YueI
MTKNTVNEFLEKGMYGTPEIKSKERIRYLSTLRERTVLALTKPQVRSATVFPQVEYELNLHPSSLLLLNGEMNYRYLSKYIKVANRLGRPFTIVNQQGKTSDLGLVVAVDQAVDQENIFIKKGDTSINKKEDQTTSLVKKVIRIFNK